MQNATFDRLLQPRGIAILGASSNPQKISGRPVQYLKRFGFEGGIYPVNPNTDEIQGLQSFASVSDIRGDVDVAMIMMSAEQVPMAVRECGEQGIGFAVIAASGFAEVGGSGDELNQELAQAISDTGIRVLGPNCLGYVGFQNGVVATFTPYLESSHPLEAGPVGFVSQSGGVGTFMFDDARELGVGFSFYISTGNEADLSVSEVLGGMLDDEDTTTLIAYLEGISNGQQFIDMSKQAYELDKPIVLLKTGQSEAGELAARSHTASLTGDKAVFEAISREAAITLASSQDEFLDAARILSTGRRMQGRKLTIVSESGGGGVMMADAASAHGLIVEPWKHEWQEKLGKVIPSFGSAMNPIDLTAMLLTEQDILRNALKIAGEYPDSDALAVLVGNADAFADPLIESLVSFYNNSELPLVVIWQGGNGEPRRRLREHGIPCFTDTARAARALEVLADYSNRAPLPVPERPTCLDSEAVDRILLEARSAGRPTLNELEASRVLASYGIPMVKSRVSTNRADAIRAASELSGPVVLKTLADDVLHKSDIGGVRVGLVDPDEIGQAADELLELSAELGSERRVLIQPMESGEVELIVGARMDPTFGPITVVGLGGVFVEVLGDTNICTAPTDKSTVLKRLRELKGSQIFDGVRGEPAIDIDAAADAVVRLSWLIHDFGDKISEIEINPVLTKGLGEGAVAVDAVLVMNEEFVKPNKFKTRQAEICESQRI